MISEGATIVAVGTKRFALRQGQGIFINTGILHAAWAENHASCLARSAVFHPRLVGGRETKKKSPSRGTKNP